MNAQDVDQLRTNVEWELFLSHHRRRKRTADGFEGCEGDDRTQMFGGPGSPPPLLEETDVWTVANRLMRVANDVLLLAKPTPPPQLTSSSPNNATTATAAAKDPTNNLNVVAPAVDTGTPDGRLRVSTKTQSLKLQSPTGWVVPFTDLFWRVPVIPYMQPREGVVKKELRVEMKTDVEVEEYEARKRAHVSATPHITVTENVYRRKYLRGVLKADVRRLNIGICQKELQCKKRTHKLAFSNCFVIYLRWTTNGGESFDESHIKVFSTGQIDLPGISDPARLHHLHCLLHRILLVDTGAMPPSTPPRWISAPHAVLINSDFLCNFQIDREKLRELLLERYKIKSMSQIEQPGLRCALFVRRDNVEKGDISKDPLVLGPEHERVLHNAKGKRGKIEVKALMSEFYFKITCTFFRTGKVLISGACTPPALERVFERMRDLLLLHSSDIRTHGSSLAVKKAKKTHYVSKTKHLFDLEYYASKVLGGPPPHAREFPIVDR